MKRLFVLAFPLLLLRPALAADPDRSHYLEGKIVFESRSHVPVRPHHYFHPPVAVYDEDCPGRYVERPYYGLRHLHLYGWFRGDYRGPWRSYRRHHRRW